MTENQTTHAVLSASSMYRWSKCPGSIRMYREHSDVVKNAKPSVYAEEGTLAHEVAAKMLANPLYTSKIIHSLLKNKENETNFDEITKNILVYVHKVLETYEKNYSDKDSILVEYKFDLSKIHPQMFGTADAVVFKQKERKLYVFDLKYGAGIPVEVKDNPQLLYYGLGALLNTGLVCDTVELCIIQPRCYHPDGVIRSVEISSYDLLNFAADLKEYALATEKEDATLETGDHCKFCLVKGVCDKIAEIQKLELVSEFSTPVIAKIQEGKLSYDIHKLSEALNKLDLLEGWIASVRSLALSEAERGVKLPGYKLVPKRALRKWNVTEDKLLQWLKDQELETSIAYEEKLKSPAQIEKSLNKKQKEKMKELVVSISSGNTLVSDSDPRPELETSIETDFGAA